MCVIDQLCFLAGGGSANLVPSYSVSPLAGIEEAAAASGASVHYCEGTPSERWMPLLSPYLHREGGEIGVDIAFYSEKYVSTVFQTDAES